MIERLSPLWLGIGISASLIVILLVTETTLGRWEALLAGGEFAGLARVSSGMLRDLRLAIVHCLLIGYLPAALLHVLRSARRTVYLLQNVLNCTREECEALAASVRLRRRGLLITGLLGIALAFLTPYLAQPVPLEPWSPSNWSPEVGWHRILGPVILLFMWWLGYAVITVSVRMSRLAKKTESHRPARPVGAGAFYPAGAHKRLARGRVDLDLQPDDARARVRQHDAVGRRAFSGRSRSRPAVSGAWCASENP